jgi:hypothetical protein
MQCMCTEQGYATLHVVRVCVDWLINKKAQLKAQFANLSFDGFDVI